MKAKSVRHFVLVTLALAANLRATPIPEERSQNGWFIGCQAYTFKEFTAFEAIAKTKEAGGNMIDWSDNVPQVRANIDFIKAHGK